MNAIPPFPTPIEGVFFFQAALDLPCGQTFGLEIARVW